MSEDLANSYAIRPNFKQKFRPAAVKTLIHDVLNEEVGNKKYDPEESKDWPKIVTDTLLAKLKELELDRYKFVVQVIIGEQRGEGVNVYTDMLDYLPHPHFHAKHYFIQIFCYVIGLFNGPQINCKDNEEGMKFGCKQP